MVLHVIEQLKLTMTRDRVVFINILGEFQK